MRNTPHNELRRRAPKHLTHSALVAFFAKHGLPRKAGLFSAFELGIIKNPPERFLELWARAVGSDVETVLAALRKTQNQRKQKTGPFRPPD